MHAIASEEKTMKYKDVRSLYPKVWVLNIFLSIILFLIKEIGQQIIR